MRSRSRGGRTPRSEKIVCPVLAALYNNGDLEPDETGFVSYEQTVVAQKKLGIKHAIAKGNGDFKLSKGVNLFAMNTGNSHFSLTGADKPYMHATSSGILNRGTNVECTGGDQGKLDELWQYAHLHGDGVERLSMKGLKRFVKDCHTGKVGLRNARQAPFPKPPDSQNISTRHSHTRHFRRERAVTARRTCRRCSWTATIRRAGSRGRWGRVRWLPR